MVEQNINDSLLGMSFLHPSLLKDGYYSLLVNGNIGSILGDFQRLTNEPSNILCSMFKDGYKVIGVLPAPSLQISFFFLVNEATQESEIGILNHSFRQDSKDKEVPCSTCNSTLTPNNKTPKLCTYNTFVNADCLNFSYDNPIKSWLKVDDCNVRIYFVDGDRNPPRYIDYTDFPKQELRNCPKSTNQELDCDKIKIFKDACSPSISYVDVTSGGQLTAGTLQFGIAYSDAYSNPITNYFYFTNKIDIWDKSKTITVNTDYIVSKSVKIKIEGINPNYDWFNLVVLKTVNNVTTPHLIETFSNTGDTFTYTYSGIDKNVTRPLTLDEVLRKTPVYNTGNIITQSNGINLIGDVTEPRILNLQPFINNLPLYWETVELNEGDYENPVIASKYTSWLRDEVYPVAIEFGFTNTNKTARFHIPGRASTSYDLEDVTLIEGNPNPDVFSSNACESPSGYNPRWKVYNTANSSGYACGYDPNDEECPNELITEFTCIKPDFYLSNPSGGYYASYDSSTNALSDPIADPCTYFSCATPSGDCLLEIEELYPSATSITNTACDIITITPGGLFTVNTYNPSGFITTTPTYPTLPAPPTNIECDSYITDIANCTDKKLVRLMDDGSGTQTLWYSFIATSDAQAITIQSIYNQTDGNSFTIQLYSSTDGLCTSLSGITTVSQSTPYFLFENLISGTQYFFTVTGDSNINTGVNDFYYICTDVPTPTGTTTEYRPDVVAVKCTYEITYCLAYDKCNAKVYEYGNFAYWESSELYPCNREIWGDLANTPIRHHKFPDCLVSPHYKNVNTGRLWLEDLYNVKNKIYPIGLRIDVEDIKNLLVQAQIAGNITQEERLSICSYRILRGNRAGNQSVISKGLLYDVWQYNDNVYKTNKPILYPNYPYNSRQPDVFNLENKLTNSSSSPNPIDHPYSNDGYKNNKYTFLGANTLFNNPGLGTEIRLELEQYGVSEGRFNEVINHPKYQYIGYGAVFAAFGFAAAEAAFDAIGTINAGGVISAGILSPFSAAIWQGAFISHYYDWLDIIRKLAPFKNFAQYYTSVGRYTDYVSALNPSGQINPDNVVVEGNIRRFLNDAQYLNQGIYTVSSGVDRLKFNNYKREGSVYLNIDDSVDKFNPTFVSDNSRWYPGDGSLDGRSCSNPNLGYVYRNISSFYGSIKNNLPNQYGQIDQIEYVDTGYNGTIDWTNEQTSVCTPVFGGDTFINRFSIRRQLPFFINDAVGKAPNTDIQYNEVGNVGYPHFFFNYPTGTSLTDNFSISSLYGDVAIVDANRYDYSFNCLKDSGSIWRVASQVFALGSILITNGQPAAWSVRNVTQQIMFGLFSPSYPIYPDGRFYLYSYGEPSFITESDYNLDLRYGVNQREGNFYPNIADMVTWTQPTATFNLIDYDNTYYYNTVYSKQTKENFGYTLNPDFSQSKEDCKVIHPNRVIYSIQDNDNNDRFDGNLVFLANNYFDFPKVAGRLINLKPLENNKVLVLQENQATIFNAYSTLDADIKQVAVGAGALFNQQLAQFIKTDLGYGGSQTPAITSTEFGTFWVDNKNGDIFQLAGSIQPIIQESESQWFKENLPFKLLNYFPDVPIDNPFKSVGMNIWWDKRFKRVFFSKKDYIPKQEYVKNITYSDGNFYYNNLIINLTNEKYFTDNSWTVAYSPIFKNFISFYSFIPDYTNSLNDYFQTGINHSESGIYNHNLTTQSYGNFYNKQYPFIVEFSTKDTYVNNVLSSVSYRAEFRRFTDNHLNYSVNNQITFDKALIYNNYQTSGNLNLIPQKPNNLSQLISYPKVVSNATEILVSNTQNIWNFNNFRDIALNNNQPILTYQSTPTYKEINTQAISYAPVTYPNNLRNDYFSIRLISNNKEHQIVLRPVLYQKIQSKP